MLLMALLSACNGCRPKLPAPIDTDPHKTDTAPDPIDTADSAPNIDTAPPPPCPVVEVEPNDGIAVAQELPLQTWSCGTFSYFLDSEWLVVTPNQSGEGTTPENTPWMTVRVEAASRGSSANPQILLITEDESVLKTGDYLTSDPRLVFPVPKIEQYQIDLAESDLLYGEDYGWYMMASLDKAPVTWQFEEVEDGDDPATPDVFETSNDTREGAQTFPLNETVFGTIGEADDFDWYKVSIPEEGEFTLVFDVDAFMYGSAADISIWVYDADGNRTDQKPNGRTDGDFDSWLEKKVAGPIELYVYVFDQEGKGSRFHWYTMSITATADE